jgi:DNA-binding CsgD family transcriptional regulator/tetratricopeptide (TPR) repeat protein
MGGLGVTGVRVVGREGEREAIEQWLGGSRPASFVIDGAAGIGKSTLWSHAVERATESGDFVLSWRASIAERDLGFAALNALLDGPAVAAAIERLPDPRRRALEGALGRRDSEARPPTPSLVGLAVADVLRALAGDRPIVVAIDDVQWLDQPSEAALAFAARRLRIEAVGFALARRTGGPEDVLSGARRPTAAGDDLVLAVDRRQRMEVGPLSVGALGRLIHERLGVAHPRPLLVRLHQACAGNPFLGLEMSRSLVARGSEPAPGEPFPIPTEAGPLIRDHLAGLSRDARRSLVIVAMAGEPTLDLVRRVLGESAGRAVDEAFEKGVLVVDGRRVRPSHPLFASTAYSDSPPGERHALREALAKLAGDPVERAIHLAATVDRPDAAMAEALASAAEVASRRGAPGVAATLFEHAGRAAASATTRARYLIDAAQAAVAAGDSERASAALRTVLEEVPSNRLRAEALLALGEIVYVEQPNTALSLLLAALDHTEGDPSLEAMAHAYIASMADMDPAVGYRSAMAAVDVLEQSGIEPDPEQLACALLDRAFHWLLAGERVATDDIDRGLALMRGAGRSFFVRRAQEVAERCLFHLGRLAAAIALDEAEHGRLTEQGQYGLLPPLDQSLSVLCLMSGDWDAARRYADECVDLVEQGEEAWRDRALTARARILAWEGDLDAARSIALASLGGQEASGDRWEAAIFCALLGFIELSVPDPRAALAHLARGLEHCDAMNVVLPTQFRFLGDLVEAAVLAGDLDLAERVLSERLEEPAVRLPLPWIRAMAARGRGLLDAARGDLDGAIGTLDAAVAVFTDELPMPFERARSQLARAQVHRRAGHRRAARQDGAAAREVFASLGARVWADRAAQEIARIGGRVSAATTLTAAERVVAELAASGRSNREIAAELVVSIRTVESQLSAVYRKLDIRSRSGLRDALVATTEAEAS